MSHRERRHKIIEDLKRLIKQHREMSNETLLFFLMTEYDCARRTALEYLKMGKSKNV